MANRTRYILEDSGRLIRESITEAEIELRPEIMSRFMEESTVRMRNMFSASIISDNLIGNVNVSHRGGVVALTLPIRAMPLRARFIVKDGVMVPEFTSDSTPMVLQWLPPTDMRLFLLLTTSAGYTSCGDQFLVAMDKENRTYRLPTTNAYENCKLCTGEFDSNGSSYADAAAKAWKQFELSDWQADLSNRGGAAGMANSKLMFRFKPLEPDGFEQLPVQGAWTALCTKVAFEFITNYITP